MRVAFLLPTLSPSGGVRAVLAHAAALAGRTGIEPAAVVPDSELVDGTIEAELPVLPASAARARIWDVAVGTWWTTTALAFELVAERRLLLVQGDDARAYGAEDPFDRLGAAVSLHLTDGALVVSDHLARMVAARRPGAWCVRVPVGVPKQAYRGLRRAARKPGTPLRVLVEGQPSLPGKGVTEAIAAARAATAAVRVTVAAIDPAAGGAIDADQVTSRSDQRGMADLYSAHDVVVKLSRSEGLGLAPIEAAHVGTPSIVTPYGGHGAWLRHGENGLLVGFDDQPAVSEWIDRLAADEALLDGLSEGALRTAEEWPSVERAAAAWLAALEEARVTPSVTTPAALAQALEGHVALGRVRDAALRGLRDWQADCIDQLTAGLAERDAKIAELNELVGVLFQDRDRVQRESDEIKASRAYRVAVGARESLGRIGRPRTKGAS